MNHITRIAAALVTSAALSIGVAGTASAQPYSHMNTDNAYYRTHLGASKQWKAASTTERKQAERLYLELFGSWNNGCKADLHHAYAGTKRVTASTPPELAASAIKGRYLVLGEYVDGICGE